MKKIIYDFNEKDEKIFTDKEMQEAVKTWSNGGVYYCMRKDDYYSKFFKFTETVKMDTLVLVNKDNKLVSQFFIIDNKVCKIINETTEEVKFSDEEDKKYFIKQLIPIEQYWDSLNKQ